MEKESSDLRSLKFSYYISIITSFLTLVTFSIAICTPPLSGPFCQGDCFQYPYTDIISRFPRDYYWMFPAILVSFSYLIMIFSIHHITPPEKKIFSLTALGFALISTIILTLDYFVQVSFIQPSLLAGETEGIAMLSQFNPHGIFIILEEMGFITMNISLFCLVPVFSKTDKPGKSVRLTLIISFALMLVSFIAITAFFGMNREYRFEVAIISITWIELIIAGILFSFFFKNSINKTGTELNPHDIKKIEKD
jgi:hypothetical protein